MARAIFDKMEIPGPMWGPTVEKRFLHVIGATKPWEATICTLKNAESSKELFGEDLTGTRCMDLDLELLVNAKTQEYTNVCISVEVGVAGR